MPTDGKVQIELHEETRDRLRERKDGTYDDLVRALLDGEAEEGERAEPAPEPDAEGLADTLSTQMELEVDADVDTSEVEQRLERLESQVERAPERTAEIFERRFGN